MKEEPHKYDDVYIEYKKELVAAGVIFLENTKAEFHMDEIPVEVRAIEYKMQLYEKFKKHMLWGRKEDFELAYTCVGDNWYIKKLGQDAVDEMKKNFRENFIDNFEFGKSLL